MSERSPEHRMVLPDTLSSRERYRLLTSLIVPRPIGWISSRDPSGRPNLAPYSFFAALSASPLLVGISIGARRGEPKDTLSNIRATGVFCVNVVSDDLLEAMNATSAEVAPGVDEFGLAGLNAAEGSQVDAPRVADAPAALECVLLREVDLGVSSNTLIIGEVKAVHLADHLETAPGTWAVRPESLRPVGRLGGEEYTLLGEVRKVPRPR